MNRLRQRLAQGDSLFGPLVSSNAPFVIEIFGHLGFDWVILDTEHAATSPLGTEIETLVRTAEAAGITAMVRVADNQPAMIIKALNAGAQAVWIPHIETVDAAARAAAMMRFAPDGHRGAAPMVRAARYGLVPWDDFVATSNRDAMMIAIIESGAGIDAVDAIAAVPGVDALCCGLFDLAVDLGIPTEEHYGAKRQARGHPRIEAAAERLLAACQRHDKIPVIVGWDAEHAAHWLRRGYRMILFGLDVAMFAGAAKALRLEAERARQAAKNEP